MSQQESETSPLPPPLHTPDPSILEPFHYINSIPGKDVRGALIDAFQHWLHISPEIIEEIKSIVSSLHNASLLVDDIEDNSKLRRGVPVAHHIYGVANTINCANYVYFLALEKCTQLHNPSATQIFVSELLNLHRGQGQDILWRETCTCPSEEAYRAMVLDKTGGLFRLAVGLMQAFSTSSTSHKDFTPLLNLLSLYFQIRDDYVNLASVSYMQTKSFCEDLTEGKFSFPIIHAINSNKSDTRLLNILRQRTEDVNVKVYAVKYMHACGSLAYTRRVLNELRTQVLEEIDRLDNNEKLKGIIIHLDNQLDSAEDEKQKESITAKFREEDKIATL